MGKDYAESSGSSPRSKDIDREDSTWGEQPLNYRVKFMCSYGGKITPRPHDQQLGYIGGHTKILAFDRIIRFPDLLSKLQSYCDCEIVFKYQLPGEDLDALISITNEEDLEHMMEEYDRMYKLSSKPPPRLRLFLFARKNYCSDESNEALGLPGKNYGSNDSSEPRKSCSSNDSNEGKLNKKWLADALESAIGGVGSTSPATKDLDTHTQGSNPVETVYGKPDSGKDDSVICLTLSQEEIQRQIQELQRLQIANHQEQARMFHGIPFAPPLPPVYYIPSHAGMFHYHASVAGGHVGQNYYAMQRVPHPDMYTMGPPHAQVGYDSAGRQVYYTASAPGNGMSPSFATAVGTGVGTDLRLVANQEGKVASTPAV